MKHLLRAWRQALGAGALVGADRPPYCQPRGKRDHRKRRAPRAQLGPGSSAPLVLADRQRGEHGHRTSGPQQRPRHEVARGVPERSFGYRPERQRSDGVDHVSDGLVLRKDLQPAGHGRHRDVGAGQKGQGEHHHSDACCALGCPAHKAYGNEHPLERKCENDAKPERGQVVADRAVGPETYGEADGCGYEQSPGPYEGVGQRPSGEKAGAWYGQRAQAVHKALLEVVSNARGGTYPREQYAGRNEAGDKEIDVGGPVHR